jgi:hypothetical protein
VNNQLREPFFNNSVTMDIEDENSSLFKYMEKAVDEKNGLMEKYFSIYLLLKSTKLLYLQQNSPFLF